MMQESFNPPVAAVHGDSDNIDALMIEFAAEQRRAGWRVRGLVQPPRAPDQLKKMTLIDLDDESVQFDISQALGAGACGCSLDPAGIATASAVLRRALDEGADLVLANRFGTLEASGGGLASEMLALMCESVPLLTVVNPRYLDAWREFTGGAGAELAPTPDALRKWFAGVTRSEDVA